LDITQSSSEYVEAILTELIPELYNNEVEIKKTVRIA
jgi:transcription antitermination factor NusA-like protein